MKRKLKVQDEKEVKACYININVILYIILI